MLSAVLATLALLSHEENVGEYTRATHKFTAPQGAKMTFALHNMDANSTLLKLMGAPKLWNGTWIAEPPATIDNDWSGHAVYGFSAKLSTDPKAPASVPCGVRKS